jgi:hypothetical protein
MKQMYSNSNEITRNKVIANLVGVFKIIWIDFQAKTRFFKYKLRAISLIPLLAFTVSCAQSPNKPTVMAMTDAQRLFQIMKDIEDRQEIITPESLSKRLPVTIKHVFGGTLENPFHEVTPISGRWLGVDSIYISYLQRGALGNVKAFGLSAGGLDKLGCFQLRRPDLDGVFGKGAWLQAPQPAHISVGPFPDGPNGEIRRNTIAYSFGGLSLGSRTKHGMSTTFDEKGCVTRLDLSNFSNL